MSASTVITQGYGSFGNTGFVITLGYGTTAKPPAPLIDTDGYWEEVLRRRRIIRSEEEEVIALASLATFFLDPGD